MKPMLTMRDYERAARTLRVDVAALVALAEVEASGSGFLRTGEPKILFEAHHFSRLTGGAYDRSHPRISSARWNRRLYAIGGSPEIRGQGEHRRLQQAITLDRAAALQSASWGKFQIMGFHWKALGYRSPQDFINAMYRSEVTQLDALVKFLQVNRLDDELRRKDWRAFARGYNGPSYRQNQYDTKLAAAYARLS